MLQQTIPLVSHKMFKNMLNLNFIGTLLKIFSKMKRKNEC